MKDLKRMIGKIKRLVRNLRKIAKMEAVEALVLGFNFMRNQAQVRPRARLAGKLLLALIVLFEISSTVVAKVKPREAEVKINGQAILVADQGTGQKADGETEIGQNLAAKLSPFEFRKPVDGGYLSQGYSWYHRANDIAAGLGSAIHPVGAGVVEFAGTVYDGKGNIVIVNHGDGLKSLYAHMGRIDVGMGNMVTTKTALGTVGLTGHTTGPHVHLEIYDHDVMVNPEAILPDKMEEKPVK